MSEFRAAQTFTRKKLRDNNFHYMSAFSDNDSAAYAYRFPVYRYGTSVTLECEVMVFIPDNEVRVNVFDRGSRDIYAPFIYYEYGDYTPILKIINSNIDKEIRKIGIERVEHNNSGQSDMPNVSKIRRSKRKRQIKDSSEVF